jgi:hypothetical protein
MKKKKSWEEMLKEEGEIDIKWTMIPTDFPTKPTSLKTKLKLLIIRFANWVLWRVRI